MADRKLVEQLNDAVDAVLRDPTGSPPRGDRRIDAMVRLAAELIDLPDSRFRARLRVELMKRARNPSSASRVHSGDSGGPLRSGDEIEARLAAIAAAKPFQTYDVASAGEDLPDGTMRFLTAMGPWTVVLSHDLGQRNWERYPRWERHPAADELLYVLEGRIEVATLTPSGPVHTPVDSGQVFVCPKGLWHWPRAREDTMLLSLTAGEGTMHSDERYPVRAERKRPALASRSSGRRTSPRVKFAAPGVLATLDRAPELRISSATTAAEADAAFPTIAKFSNYALSGGRLSGLTPWERHPDGDEMLYAIEGSVEVTVLTARGRVVRSIPEGSVFICPQGLWHRQRTHGLATMLYVTPRDTSEHSFADDPRFDSSS